MLNLFNRIGKRKQAIHFSSYCCAIFLIACDTDNQQVPSYVVQATPLVITMQAEGEIEATQAQRITTPGRQPMTIDWLAPENTQVKKGDVIARFDAQQILYDSRGEELDMLMIEQDILQNQAEQVRTIADIQSEQGFVDHELSFTERFAIDDVRVYSKLEIIETLQNKDFLTAKDTFLRWQESTVSEQNESANAILNVRKAGHEKKFNLFQESLSQLEVYAPYDGLLTYEKDKNGEKPDIGQTVFPGRVIAKLPNLDELQARVFVLSKNAIDLQVGLPVSVTLAAHPDRPILGKVKSVAGFPRSISRGNPVTYIEVVVSFNEQHLQLMTPGNKVLAKISNEVSSNTLTVPIQSLQHNLESSFVYVERLGEWQKVNVTTGLKNQFFVEIVDGLQVGDLVALAPQDMP